MAADDVAPGQVALIERFWLDFQNGSGIRVAGFSASALGHNRRLANELAELVLFGVKRAHASLKRDFEKDLEPLPQPGELLVVLDGEGRPQAIVRIDHVERRRFNEIDGEFAALAGEGDGSLDWWLAAYRQDFAERAEAEGFEMSEQSELVVEHFERVWPLEPDHARPPVPPEPRQRSGERK